MWQKVDFERIVQNHICVENTTKILPASIVAAWVVSENVVAHVPELARKTTLHLACKVKVPSFAVW
jgi:hypothetical protein